MSESAKTYGSRSFRGKEPTLPSVIRMAREGAHGSEWYDQARVSIERYADQHGTSVKRVADILSILSPRVHVSRSVSMAHHYIVTGSAQPGTMSDRVRALAKYEETGSFGGLKVNAFSRALQGDPDAVVVDVWMIRAYGRAEEWVTDRGHVNVTPKRYRLIRSLIRGTATRSGMSPAAAQAAIWTGIRARYGYVNAGDLVMPE